MHEMYTNSASSGNPQSMRKQSPQFNTSHVVQSHDMAEIPFNMSQTSSMANTARAHCSSINNQSTLASVQEKLETLQQRGRDKIHTYVSKPSNDSQSPPVGSHYKPQNSKIHNYIKGTQNLGLKAKQATPRVKANLSIEKGKSSASKLKKNFIQRNIENIKAQGYQGPSQIKKSKSNVSKRKKSNKSMNYSVSSNTSGGGAGKVGQSMTTYGMSSSFMGTVGLNNSQQVVPQSNLQKHFIAKKVQEKGSSTTKISAKFDNYTDNTKSAYLINGYRKIKRQEKSKASKKIDFAQ